MELKRKYSNIQVLDIEAKGKGLAIRMAWKRSEANILSFMDADLSSDLSFFRVLIDFVAIEGCDLVIGNRLGPKSLVISNKLLRKVASRFYNFIARLLLRTKTDDHQCGFKAMKKEAFDIIEPYLKEKGFFFHTELIAVSHKKNFNIKPLDIIWRDSKESKVSLFSDSWKMFYDVIRLRRRLAQIK